LPSGFPNKSLYAFLISPMCATSQTRHILIICVEEYRTYIGAFALYMENY
jgi:hypothetical protein